MASGGAELTVYEYPSLLIRLTDSSCLQQTDSVCGVFVGVLVVNAQPSIYLTILKTSNVIKEKKTKPFPSAHTCMMHCNFSGSFLLTFRAAATIYVHQ